VTEAFTLSAQELADHVGPTRFDLEVVADGAGASARVNPRQV
jgi:hypothetical protein